MKHARSQWTRPLLPPLVLLLVTCAGDAWPQVSRSRSWVVKFVCGRQVESGWNQVAPGAYYTAVNILSRSSGAALLTTQIATTRPTLEGGTTLPGPAIELRPSQAAEIDCADILRSAKTDGFLKGFLIVDSSAELMVTAVYTAANEREVSAIDVEQVGPATLLASCPDLTIAPVGRPVPDPANNRTTIRVAVANIGTGTAPPTTASVEDPNLVNDPRRIAEASVGALDPGAQATADLVLSYAITGSDNLAALVLTVDPKNLIPECREDNNKRTVGSH